MTGRAIALTIRAAAGLLSLPCPARAAPFCLDAPGLGASGVGGVQRRPGLCIYDDVRACLAAGRLQGGGCTIDPGRIALPATGGRYCGIDNTRRPACVYADEESCKGAGAEHGRVCVPRGAPPAPAALDTTSRAPAAPGPGAAH